MFLKVNNDYWDSLTVQLAYSKALKETQSAKVQIMLNEDDEISEVNCDENL